MWKIRTVLSATSSMRLSFTLYLKALKNKDLHRQNKSHAFSPETSGMLPLEEGWDHAPWWMGLREGQWRNG